MTTLNELHDFMKALAESVPGVKMFAYGDADEIIGRETNGTMRYPCVWMETPGSDLHDENDDEWTLRLLVMKKASPKETTRVRNVRSETHQIAKRLAKRLRYEAEEANDWDIPAGKIKLKPMYVTSDGNVGWYFDLKLSTDQECISDAELGVGTVVLPTTGGTILIHAETGRRFALTVDSDGSMVTTLVQTLTGVTSIPLTDGGTLIINNADGTLATT